MSALSRRVAKLEAAESAGGGVRILWVNDDIVERRKEAETLEREGFTVLLVRWQGRVESAEGQAI